MSQGTDLDEVEPLWTAAELRSVLKKDARETRLRLLDEIEETTGDRPEEVTKIMTWLARKPNADIAITLWAGYLERADNDRDNSNVFGSPEDVESSLIERFAYPAYDATSMNVEELVENLVPVVRASPVSELRSEKWSDEEWARERIRTAIEDFVVE